MAAEAEAEEAQIQVAAARARVLVANASVRTLCPGRDAPRLRLTAGEAPATNLPRASARVVRPGSERRLAAALPYVCTSSLAAPCGIREW